MMFDLLFIDFEDNTKQGNLFPFFPFAVKQVYFFCEGTGKNLQEILRVADPSIKYFYSNSAVFNGYFLCVSGIMVLLNDLSEMAEKIRLFPEIAGDEVFLT